ncbi:MAG: small terminase subunit [Burkholderiales bacterium RIFCSPLOWO2_12_67_14]|nr:MAG: small terminase subunit [Burkholderiales bacterium RIFCSPLOWO2_02_FULL_67_64]OGB40035.1 MAG: small terminase subunit [Burkholderiales bacterium RIFCSPHIGHO2_12_FULL_67_38]OGB46825.1 MAG: small terminase subunit [Burkholderiales bacterium RIFCSPLOWO2_12_67_14]OGB75911.1 MAG: small terminase subunit [Burkholderiales bacterium RIFCSPLOWO2_12_FULL_67_210]
MGRKSAVSRMDPAARRFLEKLLREDRHTLDELLAKVREKYPEEEVSRSGIHRYKAGFGEMVGRMREIETAAGVLVDELGEGMGDKAGALLTQAVTTLATNAALNAHNDDKISIKEVSELARAARAAMQARTMSLKEREAVEAAARRKLLEEQQANLQKIAKTQGMSQDQLDFWIKDFLGVR